MSSSRRSRTALALIPVLVAAFLGSGGDTFARKRKHSALGDAESAIAREFDEALVKAPEDQETCFAPEEPCDIKLLKFLGTATKTIDIAVYDTTLEELVKLLAKLSHKVTIRVLVDKRQARGAKSLVSELVRSGVNVRAGRQRGIMHNKFAIVDGRMVETGSYNYTNHATRDNSENQIYVQNPKVVQRYLGKFEKIWARGEPVSVSDLKK